MDKKERMKVVNFLKLSGEIAIGIFIGIFLCGLIITIAILSIIPITVVWFISNKSYKYLWKLTQIDRIENVINNIGNKK